MMTIPIFSLLFGFLAQRSAPLPPTANIPTSRDATAAVFCSTDLRWINSDMRFYSLSSTIPISLFSVVGAGCAPAEIRVSAVFLDYDQNVICSGSVDNAASQSQNAQAINLEFKPLNIQEFVRWRNGANQPPAKRLTCIGPDQTVEVTHNETDRASSVRLYLSVLARSGGMSTVEIRVDPRR
jgi:hypothetical protein